MADLIHEFFERELSAAESDALSEQLRQSTDASLRFEGLMENHYVATGLPLPELPASLKIFRSIPVDWVPPWAGNFSRF